MNGEASHVRLLPWTGAHGQPSLLVTDGSGPLSQLAARIEEGQLGLAERLLSRARETLTTRRPATDELALLAAQLTDALHDALLIAECRGTRLGAAEHPVPCPGVDQGGTGGLPGRVAARAGAQCFVLLTLPGHDRSSARAARRCVRDTTQAWGVDPGTADDLETITGELIANALEHSQSRAITLTCTLSTRSATISVTDEGRGIMPAAPSEPPGPEQEHGRGLLITDALADRWGTRRTGSGLTVWAEVTLPSPESTS